MTSTTDDYAFWNAIANTAAYGTTYEALRRRPMAAPAKPRKPFKLRKVNRDFRRDWHQEILCAYESIKGDAPPKRLKRERHELMVLLRRLLRKTADAVDPVE